MKYSLNNLNITTDLKELHQKHNTTILQDKTKLFDYFRMRRWSETLARSLSIPQDQSLGILKNLKSCYHRKKQMHCLLDLIDSFELWPGYPFILTGTFEEHVNYVCNYLSSIENALPSIPIFAFPKSASSYISVVLCNLFNVQPISLSFDHIHAIKPWVNTFSKWGGVVHEHYYPSKRNIKTLIDSGIKKFIVHTRNPINSFISFSYHMVDGYLNYTDHDLLDKDKRKKFAIGYLNKNLNELTKYYNSWSNSWKEISESKDIVVKFTTYEEMKENEKAFFKNMLEFMNLTISNEQLDICLNNLNPSSNKPNNFNFRSGKNNEWLDFLDTKEISKIKDTIEFNYS